MKLHLPASQAYAQPLCLKGPQPNKGEASSFGLVAGLHSGSNALQELARSALVFSGYQGHGWPNSLCWFGTETPYVRKTAATKAPYVRKTTAIERDLMWESVDNHVRPSTLGPWPCYSSHNDRPIQTGVHIGSHANAVAFSLICL